MAASRHQISFYATPAQDPEAIATAEFSKMFGPGVTLAPGYTIRALEVRLSPMTRPENADDWPEGASLYFATAYLDTA